MAREFIQSTFFDHSVHSNSYYAAQFVIEQFLADVLMRSDASRIVWASEPYMFRRRFELSDSQGGEFGTIKPTSLNFPFANYWYDSGFWVPDDRPFAVQTKQILFGLWDETLPAYMRSIPVKTSFSINALYNRDDDARLAYELLMWEYLPRGPIQLATKLRWRDVDVPIPVYITIEDIAFNPQYNETDWLKTHRIVPLKFKITARTYMVGYPKQSKLSFDAIDAPQQPSADSSELISPPFNRAIAQLDDNNIYITEQVILEFAAAKQWVDVDVLSVFEEEDVPEIATDSSPNPIDDYVAEVKDVTMDIVTGYFSAAEDIIINTCFADIIGMTSFRLNWVIRTEDLQNISYIKIVVPGQSPVIIEDKSITSYVIAGLQPSSEYGVVLLLYGEGDTIRDFHLTVTTLDDPNNPVGAPLRKRLGRLRGMEW
jgi:hypothetical protein